MRTLRTRALVALLWLVPVGASAQSRALLVSHELEPGVTPRVNALVDGLDLSGPIVESFTKPVDSLQGRVDLRSNVALDENLQNSGEPEVRIRLRGNRLELPRGGGASIAIEDLHGRLDVIRRPGAEAPG